MNDPTGIQALVAALQSAINADTMFSNLALVIPVIGGVLVFAFMYYIVKKVIKGAAKGKARI